MNAYSKIRIADYTYHLPEERIAKYPLTARDTSKLLIYKRGIIAEDIFMNLPDYIPEKTLMVFNNTRVIRARLLFQKQTGAQIEIFCLEPVVPSDYSQVFQERHACTWKCLIGNRKRWKNGILQQKLDIKGDPVYLTAEQREGGEESIVITFSWDKPDYTFADILEAAGVLPIPPYLHRPTEVSDLLAYQTVYSKIKGSVAAPTAGLHFTPEVFTSLEKRGIGCTEVTLHVGAGTFKPVKSETIGDHAMHTETFLISRDTIERLIDCPENIIAVGTTSVRTLESLYFIGAKIRNDPGISEKDLVVEQWEPYEKVYEITTEQALYSILEYLDRRRSDQLTASTRIMIVPGYTFRIVKGIVTNFHQPQSTLLLLIAAFAKGDWKKIYDYALEHDFRFLSYGDSSLLL